MDEAIGYMIDGLEGGRWWIGGWWIGVMDWSRECGWLDWRWLGGWIGMVNWLLGGKRWWIEVEREGMGYLIVAGAGRTVGARERMLFFLFSY
jgi:hypothetical protein